MIVESVGGIAHPVGGIVHLIEDIILQIEITTPIEVMRIIISLVLILHTQGLLLVINIVLNVDPVIITPIIVKGLGVITVVIMVICLMPATNHLYAGFANNQIM